MKKLNLVSTTIFAARAAFCLAALMAGLGLIPAGRVTAQTLTVLHSFTAEASGGTNSDGASPRGRLITNLSGNTLYGTAVGGGSLGYGAVFAVNTDGTGFTNLHSFNNYSNGLQPYAGLILSGSTLYGTTYGGGISGYGTVFAVNTDGTGFTNLHRFAGYPSDGAYPYAGLILSGNTLYGTAREGGSAGNGTVFQVNTNGTGFTTVHSFTFRAEPPWGGGYTNSDGAGPWAGLILSGNTLYGTAIGGGSAGRGTVFKVNTDGTGFTTLHSFTATTFDINSDGVNPKAGLVLSGNTLYGTANDGGISGYGTVFAVNTNGTGFTTLHSFAMSDGAYPFAELILSGNTLYGTVPVGGFGYGTVFAVNTDGTGFTTLHSFNYESAGGGPGGLVLSGNALYGPTETYGSSGNGTVFRLSFAPQLTIIPSGANVVLTWPTNFVGFDYTGFTLQSTTNLFPTAWSPVAQAAATNAGQISVTVPTSDGSEFFRLRSQ
jgi:uncharacterized repeat protein (TIGR03803 family)